MPTKGDHITFYYHKPLNSTLKLNKTDPFREVSVKKNKQPKGYLADTTSSINKKKPKYEQTQTKSSTQVYKRQSISIASKSFYRWDSCDNQFHDNLNHFADNSDFGNDPFGHFS